MDLQYLEKIKEMSNEAGFDEKRVSKLIDGLETNTELLDEIVYYIDNNDFLCKTTIHGYSIVDILIWQIDHFRAFMDRDTTMTKRNPQAMALLAVETMLEMKNNPEKIVSAYTKETGTDQIIS